MRQLKITQQLTRKDDVSLVKYFSDLQYCKTITAAQELELAKRITAGDPQALDELVRANLRFVVSVAKQYQNQGLSLSDLISEGNIGLIAAAKRYDHTRGFKFISYAVWWIRQKIMAALTSKSRMIHLPLNRVKITTDVARQEAILLQELERLPSVEELAKATGLSCDQVTEARSLHSPTSLDAPLSSDNAESYLSLVEDPFSPAPDKKQERNDLQKEIQRALKRLSTTEQEAIKMLYGLKSNRIASRVEVADHMQLTTERVRQLEKSAISKLKKGQHTLELFY